MNRNLDSVYFKIERNNKIENICFSDLTEEEMYKVLENKNRTYCERLCMILGNTLKSIGDQFDIKGAALNEQ